MSGPGLVFVHGRSQHLPVAVRSDDRRRTSHVAGKLRTWTAGLAKGLTLAGFPQPSPDRISMPYYADVFADGFERRRAAGARPDLELAVTSTRDALLLEAAESLHFDPGTELHPDDPGAAEEMSAAWRDVDHDAFEGWGDDLLRSSVARLALQFLARKTGAPKLVIESFMDDVAFYLDDDALRDEVVALVRDGVERAAGEHGSVVLVTHSLGTVVGYDLFDALPESTPVELWVTAGSPLGLPVVQRNLRPRGGPVPRPGPRRATGEVPWLNAYDVRDVVSLIHPLDGVYVAAIRDERTHNSTRPHAIEDYLADPDVARPIGRALQGKPPW